MVKNGFLKTIFSSQAEQEQLKGLWPHGEKAIVNGPVLNKINVIND